MQGKNIILADCDKEEVEEFAKGFSNRLGEPVEIYSKVCNQEHGSRLKNLKRYFSYMTYPIAFFRKRKQWKYMIGWQQFYALFYAFFCGLFHIKRDNIIVCCNFTYISKGNGLAGKLYERFIGFCLKNLDYIHVLSQNYANICADKFNIKKDKFIVTHFGIPDARHKKSHAAVEYQEYSFSIGRSNRDFDFLIEAWKQMPENEILVIASDTYKPNLPLPPNVVHRTDITGELQFSYIKNSKAVIIPIKDGAICSGDTVLLTAMSMEKLVVVTVPSTLGEMYLTDNINGILVRKDAGEFVNRLTHIFSDKYFAEDISKKARKTFLEKYSRLRMGENVANYTMSKTSI